MSTVAVVGLGYVGLPLAVAFGRKWDTIGFDSNRTKIENYRRCCDPTGEVSEQELKTASRLTVTTDPKDLARADFVIDTGASLEQTGDQVRTVLKNLREGLALTGE